MTTFHYDGIPVEVLDEKQLAKLNGIVDKKSYTVAALDRAAPALMAAIAEEAKTCRDIGKKAEKFIVEKNTVKASLKLDTRRLKFGVNIGNR